MANAYADSKMEYPDRKMEYANEGYYDDDDDGHDDKNYIDKKDINEEETEGHWVALYDAAILPHSCSNSGKGDPANLQHIVCGFYGMIIFVLGYTFPISNFLNVPDPAKGQEYLLVYHIIVYGLAIGLLIYLLVYIIKEVGYKVSENSEHHGHHDDHNIHAFEGPHHGNGSIDSKPTKAEEADQKTPKILWDAEGVSLYVRLGALLFGACTLAMNIIQFTSECRGALFVIANVVFTIFVLLQTYVLVKYHKACISFKSMMTRFSFAHIIAVNLAQWAFIVSFEITEILIHKFAHHDDHGYDHGDGHGGGYGDSHGGGYGDSHGGGYGDSHGGGYGDSHGDNYGSHGAGYPGDHGILGNVSDYINETVKEMVTHAVGGYGNNDDDHHSVHKRAAGPVAPGECDFAASLQFKLAPYLFPCIIEYSLIMAAIAYKLYFNVQKIPEPEHHVDSVEQPKKTLRDKIHYVWLGILGTLGLLTAIVSVVMIFEVGGNTAVFFFYSTEMTLFILALAGAIGAIVRFNALGWRHLEDRLDANLLLVAFFGSLAVDIFTLVSTVGEYNDKSVSSLSVARVVCSLTQAVAQVVFILDGLARCAKSQDQATHKPGQSVVLFLLLLNAGLWVMTVFELKMKTKVNLPEQFYGELPWTIIQSLFLPMVIFFRFHSTVCLADIMAEAYHYHPHVHGD